MWKCDAVWSAFMHAVLEHGQCDAESNSSVSEVAGIQEFRWLGFRIYI